MFCVSRPSFEVVKEGRISKKNQKTLTRPIEGVFFVCDWLFYSKSRSYNLKKGHLWKTVLNLGFAEKV